MHRHARKLAALKGMCLLIPSTYFGQALSAAVNTPFPCTFDTVAIHASINDNFTHMKIEGNGTTFRGFSYSAQSLIAGAYNVDDKAIINISGWAVDEKYDILGKIGEEHGQNPCISTPPGLTAALQQLLKERFALKAHWEQRQMSSLSLKVIPGRLKLKAADRTPQQVARYPDGLITVFPPFTVSGEYTTTEKLAQALSHIVGQAVSDRTGLKDRYSFKLKYSLDGEENATSDSAEDRPPLRTALQEQLGLRLVQEKSLTPVIVVDHIEHPSPN